MKNVLITGATGGIGKALVRIFYDSGYNICASGSNVERLNTLSKNFPDRTPFNKTKS